jgi:hypothetical protein
LCDLVACMPYQMGVCFENISQDRMHIPITIAARKNDDSNFVVILLGLRYFLHS